MPVHCGMQLDRKYCCYTPPRFFLNSHTGMNPGIFRGGKWEKENISLLMQVQRIYLNIPVRSLFLFLLSSLHLRGAGVGIPFSSEYLSLQPTGYAEVGLFLSRSFLYDHFLGTRTWINVGLLYFRLCLAIMRKTRFSLYHLYGDK